MKQILLILSLAFACSEEGTLGTRDAGMAEDAGAVSFDGGADLDSGTTPEDAGAADAGDPDAGATDAGPMECVTDCPPLRTRTILHGASLQDASLLALAYAGDELLIGGAYEGAITFGDATLRTLRGEPFGYLLRYAPDGSRRWALDYGPVVLVQPTGTYEDLGALNHLVTDDSSAYLDVLFFLRSGPLEIGDATLETEDPRVLLRIEEDGSLAWGMPRRPDGLGVAGLRSPGRGLALSGDRLFVPGELSRPWVDEGGIETDVTRQRLNLRATSDGAIVEQRDLGRGYRRSYPDRGADLLPVLFYASEADLGGIALVTYAYGRDQRLFSTLAVDDGYDVIAHWTPDASNDWAFTLTESTVVVTDLAKDAAGNVYATGYFEGLFPEIGLEDRPVSAGERDAFLMKLDRHGSPLWVRSFGGLGDDRARSVVVDAGAPIVTGTFSLTAEVADEMVTSRGGLDVFVAMYDAAGAPGFVEAFGSAADDAAVTLATDGAGAIALGGELGGDARIDSERLTVSATNPFVWVFERRERDTSPCGEVDCAAFGSTCVAASCDELTRRCVFLPAAEGESCDDGDACTSGERCEAGACAGGTAMDCSAMDDECVRGVCDRTSGACVTGPADDGSSCGDTAECAARHCVAGACADADAPLCASCTGGHCEGATCGSSSEVVYNLFGNMPSGWTSSGDRPWRVDSRGLQSGAIAHGQRSVVSFELTLANEATMTTGWRIDCALGDRVEIRVDGELRSEVGCSLARTDSAETPLAAGTRTVEISYVKDAAISEGSDSVNLRSLTLRTDEGGTLCGG